MASLSPYVYVKHESGSLPLYVTSPLHQLTMQSDSAWSSLSTHKHWPLTMIKRRKLRKKRQVLSVVVDSVLSGLHDRAVRRRAAAADILLTPPPPIVTDRRAAAAAADHMSASRRRRFRGMLTSCRTPAIMLLDFCNAVYNEA